jgi:hypothetical protein
LRKKRIKRIKTFWSLWQTNLAKNHSFISFIRCTPFFKEIMLMKKRYILSAVMLTSQVVLAGNLEPTSGPTDAGSAMYTLENIYNRLEGTEASAPSGFTEPTSGPTAGTGKTLTEVYQKADAVMTFVPTCVSPKTLNGTRWCDNQDGTVTDMTTGLIWLKKADWGGQKQWDGNSDDNAHVRAGILKAGSAGADLSDGSVEGDWRLPTLNELKGITIGTGTEPVRSSSMRAFSGVQASSYWSSTCWSSNLDRAWLMYFDVGSVGSSVKTGTVYVWPVRSGQ